MRLSPYWICQLAGWGALWAVNAVNIPEGSVSLEYPGRRALLDAWYFGSALLLTHGLRGWMRQTGWLHLDLADWLRRAVPACVALATIHTLLNPFAVVASVRAVTPLTALIVTATLLLLAFIQFTAWSGLYYGYHLQQRLREQEAASRSAALQALRAQVNPHFLFNSLNTLRALIDEDPARARDVVTQLAHLFRAALATDATPLVTLRQEWETVTAYLAIERARFEARLRVRTALAPDALDARLPPFLLQTLVENAVKFGVAPWEAGGEVAIEAAMHEPGQTLILHVTNRGPLAPASPASTATGLQNARRRLALLFGAHASLTLSESGGLVVARVTIPSTDATR